MKRITGSITAAALLGGALLAEVPLLATAAGAAEPDEHCTSTEVTSADVAVTCTYAPDVYDDSRGFHLAVPAGASTIKVRGVGGHGIAFPVDEPNRSAAVEAEYGTTLAGKTLDITVGGNAYSSRGGSNGGGDGGGYAGGGGGSTDIQSGGQLSFVAPGSGGVGEAGSQQQSTAGVGGTVGSSATGGSYAFGESDYVPGGGAGSSGGNGVGGAGGRSAAGAGQNGGSHDGGDGGNGCTGGGGGGAGYGAGGGGGAGGRTDIGECSGGGGGAMGGVLAPAGAQVAASYDDPAVTVSWVQHLAFTKASPDDGTVGSAYSYQFTSDVVGTTFDAPDGGLPDGLTLSQSGLLSGTPTTEGATSFGVRAIDPTGTAVRYTSVSLTIGAAATAAPVITTTSLDGVTVGAPFSQQLQATGTGDLEFYPNHELPSWLTLDVDGTLHGTPTTAGTFGIDPIVFDSAGRYDVKHFDLTVAKGTPDVAVTYNGSAFVVTVAGSANAEDPDGTVRFEVDGKNRGLVTRKNGVFTKPYTIPSGLHHFTAYYSGDDNYVPANSTQGDRNDPMIAATPDRDSNENGWYKAPVTVYFACVATTAELTTGCPAPATLRADGANQRVSRTITAKDGGRATAVFAPINIDTVVPSVRASGVSADTTYTAQTLPKDADAFTATDALSGINSLAVKHSVGSNTVTYAALATDKAGNTRKLVVTAKFRGPKPTA